MIHITVVEDIGSTSRRYEITSTDSNFKTLGIEASLASGQTWDEHEPTILSWIMNIYQLTDVAQIDLSRCQGILGTPHVVH